MNKTLIVLLGPTAVGKTKYSLLLAKKLKTEIVIADSRQVYKHLDIGTAKPTKEELKAVKHHLIDIVSPYEKFNLAIYQSMAFKTIKGIFKNSDYAIMVGGTGLYIDAVCKAYDLPDHKDTSEIKERLLKEVQLHGLSHLYERLLEKDPKSAEKIHHNDRIRIVRALEVLEASNKPISSFKTIFPHPVACRIIKIGFYIDREELYNRINFRVNSMIKEGLLEECNELLLLEFKKDIIEKGIIGYNEIFDYLDNKLTLVEATELLKKNTRNYAKRQLTWFRRDKTINWIDLDKIAKDESVVENIMNIIKNCEAI